MFIRERKSRAKRVLYFAPDHKFCFGRFQLTMPGKTTKTKPKAATGTKNKTTKGAGGKKK